MTSESKLKYCSFCEKHKDTVNKLIVGESVAICNECVELCTQLMTEDQEESTVSEIRDHYDPQAIKNYLDEYIIGQDNAKRVLSVAIANHYKRITRPSKTLDIQKGNVLLIGPTGSGKTLIAKTVAKYLNVPFVVADATTLTEAGYVGSDVESMITMLVQKADGDINKAQHGIVFIDEVDKISRKSESTSITRDVSGEGVQQALLKLIEGTECQIMPSSIGRKHPSKETITVDTTNILFIAGGAFVGLDKITEQRSSRSTMGFVDSTIEDDMMPDITSDDLVKFGMIPEFIGRFANVIKITDLTKEDLINVLTKTKNNYIDQYKYLFSLDDVELSFNDDALALIAEQAIKMKIGARSLHNQLEKILLPHMYGMKKYRDNDVKTIEITGDLVENPRHLLD